MRITAAITFANPVQVENVKERMNLLLYVVVVRLNVIAMSF
jgi:hypothetical protein